MAKIPSAARCCAIFASNNRLVLLFPLLLAGGLQTFLEASVLWVDSLFSAGQVFFAGLFLSEDLPFDGI